MTDGNTSQITNTHYSGGFQYTEDHLDFFPHAEGYVNVIDYSAFHYVYTYKDHLGNIRLKYTLDPDTNETAILEENHYYPYGLTHQGYNADHKFFIAINEIIELVEVTSIMDDKYKYKFNGMEWQDELDLNHYDFGARNYDPALGRWMNIDPLADDSKQIDVSPYVYTTNNPIRFTDPTGMKWEDPVEAKKLQKNIENRRDKQQNDINRIQNKIDNKNLSEKAIARKQKRLDNKQGRVDEMDKSIEDIDLLDKSEHTFRLVGGGELNRVTQGDDGVINIQGSSDAIHIHEIRHVSLSLSSEEGMQFSNESGYLKTTQGIGLLDEMEGYKAQYAFRPGSLPFSVKNINEFNPSGRNRVLMTRNIGSLNHKGKPVYKEINKLHKQYEANGTYKRL
ncbi:MAG: hypothetical protein GX163_10655 [Bacteroidetes bacterium]|nr:hypothetical protein [Bacteroidota bacterium]